MIEWIQTWPGWLQAFWLGYVTLHDFIQWGVMAVLAHTAWGERKKKRAVEDLLEHIHEELHDHMQEDALFHDSLGQGGIPKGK